MPTIENVRFVNNDGRLGPERLPTTLPFKFLLQGYSRFGTLNAAEYLAKWWKPSGGWNWPNSAPYCDGFLASSTASSAPIYAPYMLEPGTLVDRFGKGDTPYFAPFATPFRMRSLPAGNLNFEAYPYTVYRVKVAFEVRAGPIMPGFEQDGFGTQYVLPMTPDRLVAAGVVEKLSGEDVLKLYEAMDRKAEVK